MISIRNSNKREGKSMAALKLGRMAAGFVVLSYANSALSGILRRNIGNDSFYKKYQEKKYKKFNELKGGEKRMETKSRYEVIAELEEKKRDLIRDRDSLGDELKSKKRSIRDYERDLEDKKEEAKEFEESLEERKETINELIKSVDESLNRFAELNKKKS